MAITKCLIWGGRVCVFTVAQTTACQRLAITQPASDMTTELRNDIDEFSINIESKPRALDDTEIDSVAGGSWPGLLGVIFLDSLIKSVIG